MAHYDFTTSSDVNLTNYYTKAEIDLIILGATGSDPSRTEIEVMFKNAYTTAYQETLAGASGLPEFIDVWTNSGKGTKLFSKTITYLNSLPSNITINDEISGKSLIKNFIWVDGLPKITKTIGA